MSPLGAAPLAATPSGGIQVGLLTGGIDKPYAFGLATALAAKGVHVEFIGSDEIDSPELHTNTNLKFLNLRGNQRDDVSFPTKVRRILTYYARLIRYAALTESQVFHILWNNKFEAFDRTLLMLYYRLQGKKIALTAHNVNAGKRDANDSLLNRLTLKIQYRLADHIFVHTERMKTELLTDFGIGERAVTVIPLGINNSAPNTSLTSAEAKRRLSLDHGEKTILFFGSIGPYKGLDCLVAAFQRVAAGHPDYRLLIVGKPKVGTETYFGEVQQAIRRDATREQVVQRIEFIPDEDTELYFKAADVLVLPYTQVFQSGVLVLGYSFGLPVIAADVGSLREDIDEGQTGLLFTPGDPVDLAGAIERYFESDLFRQLPRRRPEIQDYARKRHSWDLVGDKTQQVYADLTSSGQAPERPLEAIRSK
ncbi:MAG: glycosyltransferase family 4 protein [Vicinamibacterales bacterium]